MATEMQEQFKNQNKSILTPLFHLFLFGQREILLVEESSFKMVYSTLTQGCERLVFANGDLDPDDKLYIYECIWEYAKEITVLERVKLLMIYIESDDAEKEIDHKIEQGDFNSEIREEQLEEFAKSEIFKRLNQETLLKNNIPEEVIQWLFKKCSTAALNMYQGSNFSEEHYQDIFSIFEQ